MSSSIKNKCHREILNELEEHGKQVTKPQKERASKYMGTTKFFYGIEASIKEQIVKDWIRKHKNDFSEKEFFKLLNSLYRGRTHEEISIAGRLLEMLPGLRKQIKPFILDRWLDKAEGWAEVDSLCQSNFGAEEILSKWREWKKLILKFSKDKNVHKRRASLVLLTRPVRELPDLEIAKLAFVVVEKLKGEKDILITKAISWLLRDMIKNYRKMVEKYLRENKETLSKIAVRETLNKLKTGRK